MTEIHIEHKVCILWGDITSKRFRLLQSMLPFCDLSVCLSVCLSRSCIVLKRQKILTRFLLCMTAPCLS